MKRAYMMAMKDCGHPKCGIHIVPLDDDQEPICEMIVPRGDALDIIDQMKAILYAKAAQDD